MSLKDLPEGADVFISYMIGRFFKGRMGSFQQRFRRIDPHLLEIGDGGITRGLPETALECPRAHGEFSGKSGDGDFLRVIFLDPSLDGQYVLLGVAFRVREYRIRGLGGATEVLNHRLGTLHGNLPAAEFFDQVKRQIIVGV